MDQKSAAHFEQDKQAFALLKELIESKGIELPRHPDRTGDFPLGKEVKKRITQMALCGSDNRDPDSCPKLYLMIMLILPNDQVGDVAWEMTVGYNADKAEWFINYDDGDRHYRGSKPEVLRLAPDIYQCVSEQVALEAAGIALDYFKAL